MLSLPIAVEKVQRDRALTRDHWQLDPNFRTNPSGSWHGRIVPIPNSCSAATRPLIRLARQGGRAASRRNGEAELPWRSLADFASGEAQKQNSSVKCAVRNTPTCFLVKCINQLLTNLTGSGGSTGPARQ